MKALYLLIAIFLLISLVANLNLGRFPKIPGDLYIDRPGIHIYIPFVSAIVISIILTLMFNLL